MTDDEFASATKVDKSNPKKTAHILVQFCSS